MYAHVKKQIKLKNMEKINFRKKDIKDFYKELVKQYGENGILYTFEYCSNYGIELECSSIDEIQVCGNDVVFVYNSNEQEDYDFLEAFTMEDLITFYNDLIDVIENENRENN